MKEEIYTIPVNDGFNEDCECAFCAMFRKLEQDTLDYVLSPSYMEEDVRGETNEKGFCRLHMESLYKRDNSLGVALILQSHMAHQNQKVKDLIESASGKKSGGLFGKKKTDADPIDEYIKKQPSSCYVCSRIDTVLDRYVGAFFILWKKDAEFRGKVLNSKGFCLQHFLILFQAAEKHLRGKELESFREEIMKLQDSNMERMAEDINWFTLKFDYRYKNEPWKNSKDAVSRSVTKVNSQFVSK